MDDKMQAQVAEELVALTKRYGQERFKIPRDPEDAMNFIRKFGYRKESEFAVDDYGAVTEAARLIGKHRAVWALFNKSDLTYGFYVPSDEGGSGYTPPKTGGGCFIATAVYGSPIAPEVVVLREFRDEVLLPSRIGRGLVACYYFMSPPFASMISRGAVLRAAIQHLILSPILRLVRFRNH